MVDVEWGGNGCPDGACGAERGWLWSGKGMTVGWGGNGCCTVFWPCRAQDAPLLVGTELLPWQRAVLAEQCKSDQSLQGPQILITQSNINEKIPPKLIKFCFTETVWFCAWCLQSKQTYV